MVNSDKKQIPIPIGDAINNDATAKAAFGKVMGGGSSSICAPFIGMGTPWTAEEQAELYSILSEYPPEPI